MVICINVQRHLLLNWDDSTEYRPLFIINFPTLTSEQRMYEQTSILSL